MACKRIQNSLIILAASMMMLFTPSRVLADRKTVVDGKPPCKHSKVKLTKKSKGIKANHPLRENPINISDGLQLDQGRIEERLGEEADRLLGIPYRFGGSGSRGMDCSGLTKQIYARLFGIVMPHNSGDQSRLSFLEDVSSEELQPGDLIFLGPGKKRINHVGIYLSDGNFIHASRTAGVAISSLSTRYWQNRLIGSKRVKGLISDADHIEAESVTDVSSYDWENQIVELDYHMPLPGYFMDLKIATFMEFMHSETEDDWEYFGYNPSFRSNHTGFRKGAWISTNTRIIDWLAISPSFGYVDGYSAAYEKDGMRQILGLGARVAPFRSRWSLMMSTAYSTQPDEPLQWSMLSQQDWRALDLSLGLNYRFNELWKLSVTGTRTGREFDNRQDRMREGLWPDDIFFRFDIGF
ncbi:MAG: NlpC/P60 family protein [Desulfobacteraceae bacterium]|nr:MAG: NlpC/P60 family protein [Desulfobacteraceae bacterium]